MERDGQRARHWRCIASVAPAESTPAAILVETERLVRVSWKVHRWDSQASGATARGKGRFAAAMPARQLGRSEISQTLHNYQPSLPLSSQSAAGFAAACTLQRVRTTARPEGRAFAFPAMLTATSAHANAAVNRIAVAGRPSRKAAGEAGLCGRSA